MPRYKTETRPGLVAVYDIRPGNGAGQFLQPRSPHRAVLKGRPRTLKHDLFVVANLLVYFFHTFLQ